jgi:hypothetical protein
MLVGVVAELIILRLLVVVDQVVVVLGVLEHLLIIHHPF